MSAAVAVYLPASKTGLNGINTFAWLHIYSDFEETDLTLPSREDNPCPAVWDKRHAKAAVWV